VPHGVHFVLSVPPDDVDDAAYGEWYELHVSEIMETEGFLAARRYRLEPASPERPALEYRHLALYVLDDPHALAEIDRRVRGGELTLPDWFAAIRWGAFGGRPLEDEELELADHAYLVLSHAPRRFTTEEFYGWYYAHARENLTSDGFDAVWRYALTPASVDPEGPGTATHAAFYEVHGSLPALRSALVASAEARRVDIPAWMPEGEFVSWECLAAAPSVADVRRGRAV
jgi:hypothetical protein